jgi:hypothetical protein
MKKLYLTAIIILTASSTFANPVINAVANSGNWKNNATWNLNRLPLNGDTVIIPSGKTVVIDDFENLESQSLYIKIYGTLKLSTGKLWININSYVTIADGGVITSTGSASETLRIGGVDKFSGSIDGTISFASFANKTTGSSPLGFSFPGNIILPVKFISFNVARQNNNILIQWATGEETNSSHYEVQRSKNGNDWNTIANITAAGNTTFTHPYSYTDKNVASKVVYYRILQADIDGGVTFTPERMIMNENNDAEIRVGATSSNSIYVNFSEQVKANVIVCLTAANGQLVSQKILDEPAGQVTMPIQHAVKGVYIISIIEGQDLKFSKQVLL